MLAPASIDGLLVWSRKEGMFLRLCFFLSTVIPVVCMRMCVGVCMSLVASMCIRVLARSGFEVLVSSQLIVDSVCKQPAKWSS